MYAQCPECLTFFHLKPSHLKAAGGRVRCSQCKHVFNALETLRDELTPEEIAAMQEAKRREPGADAPLLKADRDENGDLFEGLEFTQNAELGLDEPEPAPAEEDRRDAEERAALAGASGPFVEREIRADTLADPSREFTHFREPRRRGRSLLPGVLNLLLLLALLVQLVHWQRERVLKHPVAGPWLERAYSEIGFAPGPKRDLAALNVTRTEVSSHPDHPRALHLTALIENNSDDAQPWPEIRVDLQDRWGETVGARYFKASEYLREASTATETLSARTRFPVSLAIQDPGNDAVGFKVEACFATATGDESRHVCTSDIALR